MKTLLSKFRDLFARRRRVDGLEEEMRTHLELLVEEKIRAGLDPAEARRQAHLDFGNALSTRENSVEAMGWPLLESIWQDTRLAARGLRRRPAFALSLVLILAIGIGATTAIATLVRRVMLDALPVPQPEQLQLVVSPSGEPLRLSAPTIQRLGEDPAAAGRVAAYASPMRVAVGLDKAPVEPLSVVFVNGTYFSALQVGTKQGRLLTPADDELGQPRPVAVVTHRWWRTRLAADPRAIGKVVQINGLDVTIVGIAPDGFTGLSVGNNVEAFLPSGLHAPLRCEPSASSISDDDSPITLAGWRSTDQVWWLFAMVRAGQAGDLQGALEGAWRPQIAAVQRLVGEVRERERLARNSPHLQASPRGHSNTRDDFRAAGLTLSLLVAAVVLVTVANSSTLLLLRLLARRREMGVRLALGANHARLARWAMLEALLLSAAGALAGVLLGTQLTPLLARWLVPVAADDLAGPDFSLLASLAGLALFLGLLLGAAPAWLMARLPPYLIIQNHGLGAAGSLRLGRLLIVFQLVLSVLLVSVAGTLALDLRRVLQADPGFARESVVTTFFDLAAADIPVARQTATLERMRAAAESVPQVRAVAFTSHGALSGSTSTSTVYFRGDGVQQAAEPIQRESIDERYLGAMGMRLVAGRNFTPADRQGQTRVALISQRLARKIYGNANPLGRTFGYDAAVSNSEFEIVGIVADSRTNGVRDEAPAMFFLPLQPSETAHCIVVRAEGNAGVARDLVARKIASEEPSVMFTRWMTLEERTQRWIRNDLATVRLTTGFGVLATALAMLGVLGALGYLVATRSREIAVRLALGAPPARVWRDVVGEALTLGALGAGFGLVLAALLPRVLGAWMLSGLKTEWPALLVAACVGLGAAVVGGLIPARRASRVDPLALLRAE